MIFFSSCLSLADRLSFVAKSCISVADFACRMKKIFMERKPKGKMMTTTTMMRGKMQQFRLLYVPM
jgi:hypothetical protein